jgi:hypothetical protein
MLHGPYQKKFLVVVLCVLSVLCVRPAQLRAQPDPRQMAGIPRPVDDLPNGSVSVRVIRGALTNNIANQDVQLHVGTDVLTTKTDAEGRAQFDKLTPGARLKAVAVVDGERLESQEFPAPGQGGIRLLLVATGDKASAEATAPAGPPAATGPVLIAGQSRIIIQPGDETLTLYYLLDIVNNASVPVNPPTPFVFDMPTGAAGTGILQGSSPLATVNDTRVTVNGPFPPGSTLVQVGTTINVTSGSFDLVQRFPAPLSDYAVVVKKLGNTTMTSPQLAAQQVIPAQGETFLGAQGTPVPEGEALTVSLTDMPHYSPVPRRTALTLALVIALAGVWAATRPRDDSGSRVNERKRLVARREKLLGDLVRLERARGVDRAPTAGDGPYKARREAIVAALEQVYGALDDSDGVVPGSGTSAGAPA